MAAPNGPSAGSGSSTQSSSWPSRCRSLGANREWCGAGVPPTPKSRSRSSAWASRARCVAMLSPIGLRMTSTRARLRA